MVLGWGRSEIVQPRTTYHVTVQPLVYDDTVLQNGRSRLYTASCNGHLGVVKTLLEAGANINEADKVQ